MPLADFKCNNCPSVVTDILIKDITKPNKIVVCPECSEEMTIAVASAGSFVLEGRSWARDGYK